MDYRTALLAQLGAPATPENLQFLTKWQAQEGGATHNNATFNWFNTTLGSKYPSINSVGVRAFPDFATGIKQTAATLLNGRYGDLVSGLRSGHPTQSNLVRGLSTWVSGSPTSESGAAYASRVLGVKSKADLSRKDVAQKVMQMEPSSGPSRQLLTSYVMATNSALMSGQKPPQMLDYFRQYGPQMADQLPVQKGKPHSNPTVQFDTPGTPYGHALVGEAKKYLGIPYVWGGANPKTGFDCSGLVKYLYAKHGVDLPHLAAGQAKMGQEVPLNQLQPGDLVFFHQTSEGPGHEGIYIGDGQFLHAPHTGDKVKISSMAGYLKSFVTARRIPVGGQSA